MAKARERVQFLGLSNSLHPGVSPRGSFKTASNATLERGVVEARAGYGLHGKRTGAHANDVGWGFGYGKFQQSEVQRLTAGGTVSGGTFTITFDGETTDAIAWDASAADIQSALEGLGNVKFGDVVADGGDLPGDPVQVTFAGQYAGTNVPEMTVDDALLTGVAPTLTPTTVRDGGLVEEFISVVQLWDTVGAALEADARVYSVHPTTGVHTELADDFAASDWFFQQYGDKIFMVNASSGLLYKTIGSGVISGDPPTAPERPLIIDHLTPYKSTTEALGANGGAFDWTGATLDAHSGWTTPPTITVAATLLSIGFAGAETKGGDKSVTIELPANVDMSYRDFLVGSAEDIAAQDGASIGPIMGVTSITLIDDNDDEITTFDFSAENPAIGPGIYRQLIGATWGSLDREMRQNTRKVKIVFYHQARNGAATDDVEFRLFKYLVWTNNKTIPRGIRGRYSDDPVVAEVEYAYSYYNETTETESDLSPVFKTTVFPNVAPETGWWWTMYAPVSAELTGSDSIYLYRREKSTGLWRRLPNTIGDFAFPNAVDYTVNGIGCAYVQDHVMELELVDLPVFGGGLNGGISLASIGFIGAVIGAWKGSLALGALRQVWLSFVGQPLVYAPSPDSSAEPPDEDDESAGVTEYPSDNRSEEILGLIGQEPLYIITGDSVFAKIGDLPSTAHTPRRLPGRRGALGKRSFCPFANGIAVATQDGLWYYNVGRGIQATETGSLSENELTKDIRVSYATLIGTPAQVDDTVVVEYEDELFLFNGTRYLKLARSGRWEAGTYDTTIRAALTIRSKGLYTQDSRGRLLKMVKDADGTDYTQDSTGDTPSAITWTATTNDLISDRTRVVAVEILGEGVPSVSIQAEDGGMGTTTLSGVTKPSGYYNAMNGLNIPPGVTHRLTVSGGSSDRIVDLSLFTEPVGPGRGN